MRPSPLLALFLSLAVAFAGCSGSDGSSDDAAPTTPAAQPGEPQGAIEGQVLDDEGLPIAGVQVAIVEIELENTTDESGAFSFTNLPVGTYTVAASKLGFQSSAKKATVEDGATTPVELLLAPLAVAADPYHLTYTYEGKITFGVLLVPWSGIFQDLHRAYGTPNPTEDVFFFNWTAYPEDGYPASQLIEVAWTPTTGVTGQNLSPLYWTDGEGATDTHTIYSGSADGLPSPIRIDVDQGSLESAHEAYPDSDYQFGIYPSLSEFTVDQRFSVYRTDFFGEPHDPTWTYLPE